MLAPIRRGSAPIIEEGLAVYFSIHKPNYPASYGGAPETYVTTTPEAVVYGAALHAHHMLRKLDINAIQKLRQVEPDFYNLTGEMIKQVLPATPDSLAVFQYF